jgi:hypothetical protein
VYSKYTLLIGGFVTGKKFAEWTIGEMVGKNPHGLKIYQCLCSCGHKQNFTISYINSCKNFTKCKKCKRKDEDKKMDLTGRIIDCWKVIKQTTQSKYRGRRWICECKCGKRRTFTVSYLNGRGVRSATKCMSCYRIDYNDGRKHCYKIPHRFFAVIKLRAKNSVHESIFDLDIDYLQKIFDEQKHKCKISGIPINFTLLRGKNYDLNTTASLDRIDSTKGYIRGNVQFVHKYVNMMKWKLDQDYFIEICKKIAENNI